MGILWDIWNSDDIEICLDLKNNRGVSRKIDDVDILISPFGRMQGNVEGKIWENNAEIFVRVMGTINHNNDLDSGFVVELSIPWYDLGVQTPATGTIFGLDLVNVDRDSPTGKKTFISWSRTTWLTNDNPSE